MSSTALLNPAGAERARLGKANGSPERRVRGLGLAGVAEPFGHLSREKAGEDRPWLPTEYSCVWFCRCASFRRLIVTVHAVNISVMSKSSCLGEGLAVAGVFHGIHLMLFFMIIFLFSPIEPQIWSFTAEKSNAKNPTAPPDSSSLLAVVSVSSPQRCGLAPSLSWCVSRRGGCG